MHSGDCDEWNQRVRYFAPNYIERKILIVACAIPNVGKVDFAIRRYICLGILLERCFEALAVEPVRGINRDIPVADPRVSSGMCEPCRVFPLYRPLSNTESETASGSCQRIGVASHT